MSLIGESLLLMKMEPSRRDLCASWIAGIRFKQDHGASEGVMAVPWNKGGNMGTRRHYACQLSLLVQGRRYVSVINIK